MGAFPKNRSPEDPPKQHGRLIHGQVMALLLFFPGIGEVSNEYNENPRGEYGHVVLRLQGEEPYLVLGILKCQ